ncbi:unnamed protein product, partial [Laminaria digitata]
MKAAITHHMPNQFWQGCAAHKIELAIKPITEEKSIKATTALHNKVVTHVKVSQRTREKLCRLQKEATVKTKMLPLSCATRWGSTFNQAEVMLEHKLAIEMALDSDNAERRGPNFVYKEIDWANTKFYSKMLEVFAAAVKVLHGDQFLTNSMMPVLCAMLHPVIIERATDPGLPDNLEEAAMKTFDGFAEGFSEPSNAEKIAAYLDVRSKNLEWASGFEAGTCGIVIKAAVMEIYELDARGTAMEDQLSPVAGAVATSEFEEREDEQAKEAAAQELALYEKEAALPEEASSQDVLDWWFAHRSTFPTLYRVACTYLAIPATPGTAERIVSTAGNVVTLKRNRLDPETVNDLVFLVV